MTDTQENGTMTNKEKPQEPQYTIFCDLDGVLADFHKGMTKAVRDIHNPEFIHDEAKFDADPKYRNEMWQAVAKYQVKYGFVLWRYLELMPDADVLWSYIKPYHPQILTATGPDRYHAIEQKRGWVTDHFGSNVKVNHVEMAAMKAKFADPTRILIDDKLKAINPWKAAGGIGVHHTSAANTITQLKQLGL